MCSVLRVLKLMMNNFPTNEKHMKLVTSVIQNAFPSINIQKVHASGNAITVVSLNRIGGIEALTTTVCA